MNQAEMLEKKGLRCAILSDMRDKDKSGAYLHYQNTLKTCSKHSKRRCLIQPRNKRFSLAQFPIGFLL